MSAKPVAETDRQAVRLWSLLVSATRFSANGYPRD